MAEKKFRLSDEAVMLVLRTAVKHVFEGNFKCPLATVDEISREDLEHGNSDNILTGYVRISGDFNAFLCLQMPRELIMEMAEHSLGFENFKVETFAGDHILRDASGEIVNMIAGTFKNMISRVKMHCRLRPPERFANERDLVHHLLNAKSQWVLNLKHKEYLSQVILFSLRSD
jgi:hypothetical protein